MRHLSAAKIDEFRRRVAAEAARIMAEDGVHEFHVAKRRAAERLRIDDRRCLPDNEAVEEALAQHQRLFRGHRQPEALARLRRVAAAAMRFLEPFEPRLVGPVLAGTADEGSTVYLHLFPDHPEAVLHFLMDRQIPFEENERRVRYPGGRDELYPMLSLYADDTPLELTLFPPEAIRQAPLSPIDKKPQKRARLQQLQALLDE
ncbi:hypothetical protein [Endothiovibrio diazotrophicus]